MTQDELENLNDCLAVVEDSCFQTGFTAEVRDVVTKNLAQMTRQLLAEYVTPTQPKTETQKENKNVHAELV